MAQETLQQNQQNNQQGNSQSQQTDKSTQSTQGADKQNTSQPTKQVDPTSLQAEVEKLKAQVAGFGQEIQNAYLLGQQEALKSQGNQGKQNDNESSEQIDPGDPFGITTKIDTALAKRDELSEYKSAYQEYGSELSQKFHPAAQGIDKAQLDTFTKQEAARIVDNPNFYPNLPPRQRMLQAFNAAMAGRYVPIVNGTQTQEKPKVSNGVSDYGGQLQPSQQTLDVIANAEKELNQLLEEINKPGVSAAVKSRLVEQITTVEDKLFKLKNRANAGLQT